MSMTYLKQTFVYNVRQGLSFIVFPYRYLIFPLPFVEKMFLSTLDCFSDFFKN